MSQVPLYLSTSQQVAEEKSVVDGQLAPRTCCSRTLTISSEVGTAAPAGVCGNP